MKNIDKKTETVFTILKPAVLQDGAGGSALLALCIFAVIKGESCRTGNKSLPSGETSGVSWTQSPWGGRVARKPRGMPGSRGLGTMP